MPHRSPKPCRVFGCAELVYDDAYCERHRRVAYNDNRESAARRGYDNNWKKLRAMVLRERPLCSDPFNIHGNNVVVATEVDHIIPIAQGGDYSLGNLQPLCSTCHSKKTRKENIGGEKYLGIMKKRPCGQFKNHDREMEDRG